MPSLQDRSDEERLALARQEALWSRLQARSRALIYATLMRAGGEPFGRHFDIGLPTLTERAVRRIKLRGFFSFETVERTGAAGGPANKFTRFGAAPFRGAYVAPSARRPDRALAARLRAALARGLAPRRRARADGGGAP